ncbi:substrate-binding domain-containing protein [Streptomyces sp. NPDC059104]|uniref:substrate-binding domain-containing protein n=1 Tax=Streptomyces sp. NPDC059104 TaxID=3346729 RepID=UPI0036D18188
MQANHQATLTAAALLSAALTLLAGCGGGPSPGGGPSSPGPSATGCPTALARAGAAVRRAENTDATWTGPTAGPAAVPGKTLVYVAQTMTNPGVAGVAKGIGEAADAIGWKVRVIDGGGTPAGIQAAFSQAVTLKPSGIVIGGFDPALTSQQVAQARAAHIPLVGWHAVGSPGPNESAGLFTNVTTKVEDVARISADWIIARSRGNGGVVVFTDDSIPFARNKAELIKKQLADCPGVRLLAYENIPIPDAGNRTPQEVSSLLARFGDRWTDSVAINDLYFSDAAPALRAAGAPGSGPPFNIGAGDGDPSAFQRINSGQFQAATVPEPLSQQGWQIVDEFNRAFAGRPASGYVAPVHIATAANSRGLTSWDPAGYREAYRRIWAPPGS